MNELRVKIRIRDRAVTRWAFLALTMGVAVPELSSENVSLTTFYPAPSGVYTRLISTNDAFLARDGGNVRVGSSAAPGKKLDVTGKLRGTNVYGSSDLDLTGSSPIIAKNTNCKTVDNPYISGVQMTVVNFWTLAGQTAQTICGAGYYPTFASGVIGAFDNSMIDSSSTLYKGLLCCACSGVTFAPYCP